MMKTEIGDKNTTGVFPRKGIADLKLPLAFLANPLSAPWIPYFGGHLRLDEPVVMPAFETIRKYVPLDGPQSVVGHLEPRAGIAIPDMRNHMHLFSVELRAHVTHGIPHCLLSTAQVDLGHHQMHDDTAFPSQSSRIRSPV